MSFLHTGGTRRTLKVGATVVSLLAFQVLTVIGAGSASALDLGNECQRNAATDTVTVNMSAGDQIELFVNDDGEIRVYAQVNNGGGGAGPFDCGSATTDNTAQINVLGTDAGSEIVEIENSDDDGGLVTGNTEATNTDSFGTFDGIPISVDLGQAAGGGEFDQFSWQGSTGRDVVTASGDQGVFNLDANGSAIEVEGADNDPVFLDPGITVELDEGNDYYDGDGTTARTFVNGEEDGDVIISGMGPDQLTGNVNVPGGDPGDAVVYDRTQDVSVSLNFSVSDADDGANCVNDTTFFAQPFQGACEGDDSWNFRIVQSGSGNDELLGDAGGFSEAFLPGLGNDNVDGAGEDFVPGTGNQQSVDGDVLSYGWVNTLRTVAGPCNGPVTFDVANATTQSLNTTFPTPNACGTDTWTDVEEVAGSNDDLHPQADNGYGFTTPGGVFTIVNGDTLDFSQEPAANVTNGVNVDLENGPIDNNLGGGLSLNDICEPENSLLAPCPLIENAIGTEFDDDIDGNVGRNILIGLGGDDFFYGDRGNDVLLGLGGNDDFNGGPGADSVWFGNSPNGVTVDASLGFATGEGDDTFDVQAQSNGFDIEIFWGSQFADNISGGLSGFGSGINFRLIGKAGDDILTGADSNDTLLGGKGNDVMRGGAGLDILRGAQGEDWGYGGAGRDICRSTEHVRSC